MLRVVCQAAHPKTSMIWAAGTQRAPLCRCLRQSIVCLLTMLSCAAVPRSHYANRQKPLTWCVSRTEIPSDASFRVPPERNVLASKNSLFVQGPLIAKASYLRLFFPWITEGNRAMLSRHVYQPVTSAQSPSFRTRVLLLCFCCVSIMITSRPAFQCTRHKLLTLQFPYNPVERKKKPLRTNPSRVCKRIYN